MERGQSLLFCLVKLGKKVFWFISGWMLMGLVFICAGFIMYLVWGGVSSLLPNVSGVVRSIASTLTIVSVKNNKIIIMGFEFGCDSTFIWVAAIISIFVFCALFLDGIGDFFGKLIGLVTLGGVFGIVFGAFGWLAATLIFSWGVGGFVIGFIVGIIYYICKWW